MDHLFQYSHQNPHLPASDALRQLAGTYQNSQPNQVTFNPAIQQHALNPSLQPSSGQRTPSFMGPNHFSSPATAHLNLPVNTTSASPATLNMSPAMQNHVIQNHLQQQLPTSVGMVAQQSQQGTNTSAGTGSQGTSANTSPMVTNKRRRSQVKVEGDDGGGTDINGTGLKVKPSPRIGGGGKRQKGGG